MNNFMIKTSSILAASLILCGCAGFDFLKLKRTPESIVKDSKIAPTWQAPLPHDGSVQKLGEFWQQFNDVLLIELIDSAQQVSPNIAAAKTRIAQARSSRINQVAMARPTLDANFSTTRAKQQPEIDGSGGNSGGSTGGIGGATGGGFSGGFGSGATNTTQIGLQSAWELDLFGVNKVLIDSAIKTENAAQAGWHDARVSVAAELATSYMNLRFCNAQAAILVNDLTSRKETARITAISIKAGFTPAASQYLADASVLDTTQQLNLQQASCDAIVKELVALTDMAEPSLREKIAKQNFNVADMQNKYQIDAIPAQTLAQRPDIISAEADLIAAAADVQRKQVTRLPRVSLNGSIGWMWLSGVGFSGNGEVWSLGPLSVTLPIFDSGKRKGEADSAKASYEESAVNYRNKLRVAVKEVETALVDLHSTQARHNDLQQALVGYQASFKATESKVRAGFANLIELEESRRLALQTEVNLVNMLQTRTNAWVSLYRAAGGDWQNAQVTSNTKSTESTKPKESSK
jgi:outer membrane protein, multidrug efflux system